MYSAAAYVSEPYSGLPWELNQNAAPFGESPIGAGIPGGTGGAVVGKRLYRLMTRMREKTLPAMMRSANNAPAKVYRRFTTYSDDNPLVETSVVTSQEVNAIVTGPSQKNMEDGLVKASDFECLIAAADLSAPLKINDAIEINGIRYDVVSSLPYSQYPVRMAYRYGIRRAV